MNTMNTTTSKYLSDHYMAAAKWVRGIEGLGKVNNIEVYPLYTLIAINENSVLRSGELSSLSKLCEASGLEYVIMYGEIGMIIIIDRA
jgi:formyltetrahydrofolate synthetase